MIVRKLIAEFIGTLVLVFSATSPIVLDAQSGMVGIFGIAFSPAVGVGLMVYAFARTSGAHFNPAVSLGFLVNRSITPREFVLYFVSQVAGAVAGSVVVMLAIGSDAYLGSNFPGDVGFVEAFLVEVFLTFLLMGVILAVAHTKGLRGFGGAAIGLIIGLDILFGGVISGASMNPARSLAPALLSSNLEHLQLYLSAPFVGSILATISYIMIRTVKKQ